METSIAQVELDTFMREFVPGDDLPTNVPVKAFNADKFSGTAEQPIYGEMCAVADSVFRHVPDDAGGPKFVAKDTHRWGDPTDKSDDDGVTGQTPDVIVYPTNGNARKACALDPTALTKAAESEGQESPYARTVWHWASLVIKVKIDVSDSPFVVPQSSGSSARSTLAQPAPNVPVAPVRTTSSALDPEVPGYITSPSADTSSAPPTASTAPAIEAGGPTADGTLSFLRMGFDRGEKTMGQLREYTSKVMRRGSRLFVFSVFVCHKHAWFLYWDRAGLIVSKPFSLMEQPQILHNFLYRFAHLDDEQRGLDPTFVLATEEEAQQLRSYSKFDTTWQRKSFEATLPPGWPIYKMYVLEADMIPPDQLTPGAEEAEDHSAQTTDEKRTLLVGKPHFTSDSVTGRATKGYFAYDTAVKQLVFCKEYWRVDVPTSHPEGDVYLRLHRNKVPFIPTPLAAGDVRRNSAAFCTRSQEFLIDSPPRRIAYRLVLKEIAEPLQNYRTSLQLVRLLYHCLLAHGAAWMKARVLHRDISENNILLYWHHDDNGRLHLKALLVDWAFSKYAEEFDEKVIQHARLGTWQFMSAVLLVYPGRFRHSVSHDIESVIHVLHRMCLRFHNTDLGLEELGARVSLLYDFAFTRADGVSCGGREKLSIMQDGRIPFKLQGGSATTRTGGLYALLTGLAKLYQEHYASLELPDSVILAPPSTPADSTSPVPDDPQDPIEMDTPLPLRVGGTPTVLEVQTTQSSAKHHAVLDDYADITMLFYAVLQGASSKPMIWTDDVKGEDRFESLKRLEALRHADSREASKRSSDGSSGQPAKRVCRSTTRSSQVALASCP